jgi:integrase/recombinase XerD
MRTIQAVLYQRNLKDKAGIIKIRVCEKGKRTYVSTQQKLLAKHWDARKCLVKETDEVDHEYLNRVIAEVLAEVRATFSENLNTGKRASFIAFFEKVIDRQTNEGTKIKYAIILTKVKAYLKDNRKEDLTFKEITEDMVYAMMKFFMRGMEEDTAHHYLKVIKGVIRKAVKANVHNYIRNPFEGVKLKGEASKAPSSLTPEQLEKVAFTVIGNERVEACRRTFLFQVFCQGMRVSDLLLLRWNNFMEGRVEYRMLKTGKDMSISLNDNLVELLRPIIEKLSKRGETTGETIDRLSSSKKHKNLFVFPYLNSDEFNFVDCKNDFSRIGKELYVRLNKKSIVYNRNLKEMQKAISVKTTLTSHTARHTFASLLLDGDVNLYAISQSLGHSDIKITQKYLSNFRSKKLDDINESLVNRFRL